MAEILHHLECENLVNNGITYLSTGAGFLPSTVSWWIFPAAWCVPQWRSSVKNDATPRFIWQDFFRTKRWGRNSQRNGFQCFFLSVFLWHLLQKYIHLSSYMCFQLCLAKTFQNCSDHPFFVLNFSGRGKAPRHFLMSCFFLESQFSSSTHTPWKLNILNLKNHPIEKGTSSSNPISIFGVQNVLLARSGSLSYRKKSWVETASYYPFTDLSTSKNMSLINSMSCIINHKFAPVNM